MYIYNALGIGSIRRMSRKVWVLNMNMRIKKMTEQDWEKFLSADKHNVIENNTFARSSTMKKTKLEKIIFIFDKFFDFIHFQCACMVDGKKNPKFDRHTEVNCWNDEAGVMKAPSYGEV